LSVKKFYKQLQIGNQVKLIESSALDEYMEKFNAVPIIEERILSGAASTVAYCVLAGLCDGNFSNATDIERKKILQTTSNRQSS
jgi:hypothetical protein